MQRSVSCLCRCESLWHIWHISHVKFAQWQLGSPRFSPCAGLVSHRTLGTKDSQSGAQEEAHHLFIAVQALGCKAVRSYWVHISKAMKSSFTMAVIWVWFDNGLSQNMSGFLLLARPAAHTPTKSIILTLRPVVVVVVVVVVMTIAIVLSLPFSNCYQWPSWFLSAASSSTVVSICIVRSSVFLIYPHHKHHVQHLFAFTIVIQKFSSSPWTCTDHVEHVHLTTNRTVTCPSSSSERVKHAQDTPLPCWRGSCQSLTCWNHINYCNMKDNLYLNIHVQLSLDILHIPLILSCWA